LPKRVDFPPARTTPRIMTGSSFRRFRNPGLADEVFRPVLERAHDGIGGETAQCAEAAKLHRLAQVGEQRDLVALIAAGILPGIVHLRGEFDHVALAPAGPDAVDDLDPAHGANPARGAFAAR